MLGFELFFLFFFWQRLFLNLGLGFRGFGSEFGFRGLGFLGFGFRAFGSRVFWGFGFWV